jgi:hypothetical protein
VAVRARGAGDAALGTSAAVAVAAAPA